MNDNSKKAAEALVQHFQGMVDGQAGNIQDLFDSLLPVQDFVNAILETLGGNPTAMATFFATWAENLPWLKDFENWVPNIGADLAGLRDAVEGTYVGNDVVLNAIQRAVGAIRSLAGGLIDPSRIPQIFLGQLSNQPSPNLLSGFGDFSAAGTIDGGDVWVWDESEGHTTPGSVRGTADGERHVLTSELVSVSEGQKLDLSGWAKWAQPKWPNMLTYSQATLETDESVLVATPIARRLNSNNAVLTRDNSWSDGGNYSVKLTADNKADTNFNWGGDGVFAPPYNAPGSFRMGTQPGRTYRMCATFRLTEAMTSATTGNRSLGLTAWYTRGQGSHTKVNIGEAAPNAAGEYRLEGDFTIPADATGAFFRIYFGYTTGTIWIDRMGLFDITDSVPPAGYYVQPHNGIGDTYTLSVIPQSGDIAGAESVIKAIANPSASGGWSELNGTYTVPAGVDGVRVRLGIEAPASAGVAWFDDVSLRKTATSLPQQWVSGLAETLGDLWDGLGNLIDNLLASLGIPPTGTIVDRILDLSDEFGDWLDDTQTQAAKFADLVGDLLADPGKVLGTLPQTLVSGLSTSLNSLQSFIQNLLNAILQGIRGVPVVGGSIANVIEDLTGMNKDVAAAAESADVAQAQIVTIQQVFAVRSNRPLWEGLDPTGESTFPYTQLAQPAAHGHTGSTNSTGNHTGHEGTANSRGAHSHDVTVTNWGTSEIPVAGSMTPGGCIRIESPVEKRQITFQARRSGAVSSFYIDVYHMEDDGSFTLLHSSANIAADILTVMTWQQVEIPPTLVELGDVIMIQFRANANCFVAGIQLPAPANALGFRPLQIGMLRNSSDAPAVLSQTAADSAYSGYTPYIQLGSDVGQLNAARNFYDNFNRTILGSNWAANWRSNSGGEYLTVSGNRLVNPTSGMLLYQRSLALYTLPLSSDDVSVEFDLTSVNGVASGVIICADNNAQNYVGAFVTTSGGGIWTNVGGVNGTMTERSTVAASNNNARWKITYTSADNTYRLYKNEALHTSWTDSTNIIGHGKGRRFCGAQIDNQSFTTGSPIDNWNAYDNEAGT